MATQYISPITATAATRNSSHPANELRWQTGQILHGKIMQDAGSEKFLRIGRQDFAARGLSSLNTGQSLKLEVIQTGNLPVLRLLQETTLAKTLQTQKLQDLPRQTSPLQLISLLNHGAKVNTNGGLSDALTVFVNRLPVLEQAFTSDNLKQLLKQSGLFLEQQLAQPAHTVNLGSDIKAAMLLLRTELRRLLSENKSPTKGTQQTNVPPPDRNAAPRVPALETSYAQLSLQTSDYLDSIESVLARHRLNQIESIPGKQDGSRVLLLEIPVRHEDKFELIQLRIEQEDRHAEQDEQTWSVEIAVNPESIGPVHAKLTLSSQEVSITLWITETASANRLTAAKELLFSHLRQAGLSIKQIQIFQGSPPQNPAHKSAALLEQKA